MKNTIVKIGLISSIIFCITSCASIKPTSVKSGQKIFETFYLGDNGTQYFIKPIDLESSSEEELMIDITFIYKNIIADSASANFSILSNKLINNIDSLKIGNATDCYSTQETKFMFSERSKRMFNSRFSCKISLALLINLFQNNNWIISIYTKGETYTFTAPNSTAKKIDKLNYLIFSLVK